MTLEMIVTLAILISGYILGCYWIDTGISKITRLELKAAIAIEQWIEVDEKERHDKLYYQYVLFARFNMISYEDYLKLVITYGTVDLI